jgi:RasGEF domain
MGFLGAAGRMYSNNSSSGSPSSSSSSSSPSETIKKGKPMGFLGATDPNDLAAMTSPSSRRLAAANPVALVERERSNGPLEVSNAVANISDDSIHLTSVAGHSTLVNAGDEGSAVGAVAGAVVPVRGQAMGFLDAAAAQGDLDHGLRRDSIIVYGDSIVDVSTNGDVVQRSMSPPPPGKGAQPARKTRSSDNLADSTLAQRPAGSVVGFASDEPKSSPKKSSRTRSATGLRAALKRPKGLADAMADKQQRWSAASALRDDERNPLASSLPASRSSSAAAANDDDDDNGAGDGCGDAAADDEKPASLRSVDGIVYSRAAAASAAGDGNQDGSAILYVTKERLWKALVESVTLHNDLAPVFVWTYMFIYESDTQFFAELLGKHALNLLADESESTSGGADTRSGGEGRSSDVIGFLQATDAADDGDTVLAKVRASRWIKVLNLWIGANASRFAADASLMEHFGTLCEHMQHSDSLAMYVDTLRARVGNRLQSSRARRQQLDGRSPWTVLWERSLPQLATATGGGGGGADDGSPGADSSGGSADEAAAAAERPMRTQDATPLQLAEQITWLGTQWVWMLPLWTEIQRGNYLKRETSPFLHAWIDCNNMIVDCIIREVLAADLDVKRRSAVLTRWIGVGAELVALNNLDGAFAVRTALASTPIERLSLTWKECSPKTMKRYKALQAITDYRSNYASYRSALEKLQWNSSACWLPYIGAIMRDMTFIAESSATVVVDGIEHINWKKMTLVHHQLEVLDCARRSPPEIEPNHALLRHLLRFDEQLSDMQRYALSTSIETRASSAAQLSSPAASAAGSPSSASPASSASSSSAAASGEDADRRRIKRVAKTLFSPADKSSKSKLRIGPSSSVAADLQQQVAAMPAMDIDAHIEIQEALSARLADVHERISSLRRLLAKLSSDTAPSPSSSPVRLISARGAARERASESARSAALTRVERQLVMASGCFASSSSSLSSSSVSTNNDHLVYFISNAVEELQPFVVESP